MPMNANKLVRKIDKIANVIMKKNYYGEGVYAEIAKITYDYFEGDYGDPICYVTIRFGRYEPEGKNNFDETARISINSGNNHYLKGILEIVLGASAVENLK